MKTGHKVVLTLLWIATCLACLWIGYSIRGVRSPREVAGDPNTAKVLLLPPDPLIAIVADKGLGPQVNILRQKDSPQSIAEVKVWAGKEGVLSASFYKQSGLVRSISIKRGNRYVRDWGFRQDGSVEYATIYEQEGNGNRGTRQYFDKKGQPTRSERLDIHHG